MGKNSITLGQAREPLIKGNLSTVDLLVLTSLDQQLWIIQTSFSTVDLLVLTSLNQQLWIIQILISFSQNKLS